MQTVIFIQNNGVSLHRLITPYQYLHPIYITGDSEEDKEKIRNSDIFIFNRSLPRGLIEFTKTTGCKIICDIDDYWKLEQTHPLYEEYKKSDTTNRITRHILLSDYITTTTELLANVIEKELGVDRSKIRIFPNTIHPSFRNTYKNPSDRVRFGLLGSTSHIHDNKLLEDTAILPKETLDRIQFVNCGFANNPYSFYTERILTNNYKNISEEYKELLSLNDKRDYLVDEPYIRLHSKDIFDYMQFYSYIDYLLIPLQENKFNSLKSPLKLAECAATNTIPIFSNVQPYSNFASNACYKLSNSLKSWSNIITTVLKKDTVRREILQSNLKIFDDIFNYERIHEERKNFVENVQ